jgi:RNA polymerase subunit RPABC4/transcription elongation factor Spt4
LVHNPPSEIDRKEALKYIDYIKTYIHETKLSAQLISVGELSCYSCDSLVDDKWKYCPSCGVDLSEVCKKCGEILKPEYVICPKCETPRSGVKVEKPNIIYKYYCQAVWSDGYLSFEENTFLKLKRKELGLDIITAEMIESKYAPLNAIRFRDSVETCLIDGAVDEREKRHLKKFANDLSLTHDLANSIYLACLKIVNVEPLFEDTIN